MNNPLKPKFIHLNSKVQKKPVKPENNLNRISLTSRSIYNKLAESQNQDETDIKW